MLSIIISWRNRKELAQALPSLLAAAHGVGGDVNIVNYSGDAAQLAALCGAYLPQLNIINVDGQEFFNKAAAQNVGASQARHPALFFCDCDIILPDPALLRRLCAHLAEGAGRFVTLAGVQESEVNSRQARHVVSFGYELNIRTADGRRLRIVDNEEDGETGTRQAPGLLLARRDDFLAIGGYNSDLHGWGWEDQDMISRLTLGRGLERVNEGVAVHISHDDHARIAHYPQVASRWESRDRMFRQALANYDDANFSGSYPRDLARLEGRIAMVRGAAADSGAVHA
ncbi:glycosyltransferase family 2 protein [Chromobacterium subtsugae]|uniref:glycosyltransferase family 2 protein n=1 Tax=Chromobacterium subtsugae TaxID=251747 RepID=UPI0007F8B01D|nr:glycosyltransferase family 2 protein [Chromobacterium subtsugae]